jgi:hypothetical protein
MRSSVERLTLSLSIKKQIDAIDARACNLKSSNPPQQPSEMRKQKRITVIYVSQFQPLMLNFQLELTWVMLCFSSTIWCLWPDARNGVRRRAGKFSRLTMEMKWIFCLGTSGVWKRVEMLMNFGRFGDVLLVVGWFSDGVGIDRRIDGDYVSR